MQGGYQSDGNLEGLTIIIGHSHHWVHVMTTLGTFSHLRAISLDLVEREHHLSLDTITFSSSLGWVLATTVACVLVVAWFGYRLTPSGTLKNHSCQEHVQMEQWKED